MKDAYNFSSVGESTKEMSLDSRELKTLEAVGLNAGDLKKLIQGQFEILDDKESTEDINKNEINQQYKKLRVVVTSIYAIEKIK